jgi:hypothetical protein
MEFCMDPDPRIHTSDFDLMIEGSGSGRPKNIWILRMRIRNTGRININPGVSLVVEPAPVLPAQLAGKRSCEHILVLPHLRTRVADPHSFHPDPDPAF